MVTCLILMRLAKSNWNALSTDHDRDFNNRDRSSAVAMGTWLQENNFSPEEALMSTAKHTRETLVGLKINIKRTRFLNRLYNPFMQDLFLPSNLRREEQFC